MCSFLVLYIQEMCFHQTSIILYEAEEADIKSVDEPMGNTTGTLLVKVHLILIFKWL